METTNRDDWEHVGPYRIQDRIGSGGYAEVYSGVDTRSGQRVALKRLRLKHLDDPDSRERFQREGLALEAIDHPNIVRCFGIHVQDDDVWIVMELLKGFTLRQFLRDRGSLSVERALLIAIDVADGLADMHEMAIVHRDLKPENVFLTMPGFVVKVVDLGVAKFHGWSVPTTDPGTLVCTPSYAAPEMSLGYSVDARSDIYALGLLMYEMLIGKNPFANGDGTLPHGQDALTAHIVRTPPPIAVKRPDVPDQVNALIAQMMNKDPVQRPPAMKVVARELRRALRTLRAMRSPRPSRPTPEPPPPRLGSSCGGATAALAVPVPVHPQPSQLFLLPPVALATDRERVPATCTTPSPARRLPETVEPLPTPHASPLPAQDDRMGLALVFSGTMLIGAACGVVLAVRAWGLAHAPPASSLYALIVAGALTGTAGALLLSEPFPAARFERPRPSAWILAIGVAAGLLLGAAGTWLFVNAPRALPRSTMSAPERPS
ncbi:MAG: protein kinase [Polyangiaceae bacterium]